jgi:hypothetical protein
LKDYLPPQATPRFGPGILRRIAIKLEAFQPYFEYFVNGTSMDHRQSNPVDPADPVVVKNGSMVQAIAAASIPMQVSLTDART